VTGPGQKADRPPPALLAGLLALVLTAVLFFLYRDLFLVPALAYVALCLAAPFLPRLQFFGPVIRRGLPNGNEVALTFDDGPYPESTKPLLALLATHEVPATFFVVGRQVEQHPDLAARIVAAGHEVGTHTYSHDVGLALRTMGRVDGEIDRGLKVLSSLGIRTRAFRPPVGISNPRVARALARRGLDCVGFSVRGGDAGNRRLRGLAARVLTRVSPGDIVLLHDRPPPGGGPGVADWLEEVEKVLSGLKTQGLRPVLLSSLTRRPVMVRQPDFAEPG